MSLPLTDLHDDILPEIAAMNTKRDKKRMSDIAKIRIDYPHLRVLDANWKRSELWFRYLARTNSRFGKLFRDLLYEQPDFFKQANFMPFATLDRDCREMEERGLFEKGNEQA